MMFGRGSALQYSMIIDNLPFCSYPNCIQILTRGHLCDDASNHESDNNITVFVLI